MFFSLDSYGMKMFVHNFVASEFLSKTAMLNRSVLPESGFTPSSDHGIAASWKVTFPFRVTLQGYFKIPGFPKNRRYSGPLGVSARPEFKLLM